MDVMRNGKIVHALALGMAGMMAFTGIPVEAKAGSKDSIKDKYSDEGYSLVWNDEFDGDSLNLNDWNVEKHEPGWVNSELQRYTGIDEGNIEVKDGNMVIKPHVEEVKDGEASEPEEEKITHVSFEFTVGEDKKTSESIALQVNFGKIDDSEAGSAKAKVKLSNVSLVDTEDDSELVRNGSFSNGDDWYCGITSPAEGSYKYEDGNAILDVEKSGDANWNYQLQQSGLKLEQGHTYRFSMDAVADADRMVEISLLDPDNGYNWYAGTKATIEKSAMGAAGTGSSKREITSGRITTQGLHDFTYGRFEARAKVPEGKGYLPAFWLMATDEGLYGQWPKCGEIDIMEVMGQDVSKSYHTIHYGYSAGSGHKENQGSKVLSDGSFADEYHTYRVDWEPGLITWYVDDEKVYSTNDWYTGSDDNNQVTYPAPFDQDFYIILNLAVGGSWVGYPDDSVYEHMNDDSFAVDYVRVYQKSTEEYEKAEAETKRPEKEPVKFREPDEAGNYVINGDFAKDIAFDGAEDASDDNWKLHLESDAKDTKYTVKDNQIKINPTAVGSQPHSVQLKQQNIPMYKGWEYELTFDAVADEDRDIIIDVEGPDRGWIRYMQDTSVPVSTKKQSYTYTFTMNEKTDANGSLEFNLGKQNSTAAVTISNVKLTHKSGDEIVTDDSKTIRPDGNYIYNGGFDQGENRLGYWDINNKKAVSVTNKKNSRLLKVVAPKGTSKTNPVKVSQSELSPMMAGQYELSFNGYADVKDGLTVNVAGKTYTPELTNENVSYSHKFVLDKNLDRKDSNIEFMFTKPGEYYIDNVFLAEAALLKNGSFNAGLAGFSPYVYDSVKASYVIDNMNGNDNTFAITIDDTVADSEANSWYVQLNQDGIKLEKGKKYRVSFKAKSSIDRLIKYSLQEFEGNWTNYSGTGAVEIGNEWKTFTNDFVMESETDPNARFNITMGSVDGIRITEKHDVYIDDISLIELSDEAGGNDEPTKPSQPSSPSQPSVNPAPSGNGQSSSNSGVVSTPATSQKVADTKTPLAGNVPIVKDTKKADNKTNGKRQDSNNVESGKTKNNTEDSNTKDTVEDTAKEETKEVVEDESVDSKEAKEEKIEEPEAPKTAEKEHVGFFAAIVNFFKAILDFFKSLF